MRGGFCWNSVEEGSLCSPENSIGGMMHGEPCCPSEREAECMESIRRAACERARQKKEGDRRPLPTSPEGEISLTGNCFWPMPE